MTLPTPRKADIPSEIAAPPASLDSHHPLEDWMNRGWVRRITAWLTAERPGNARPHLLRAIQTYADPKAPLHERAAYAPIHLILDWLRGKLSRDQLREKLSGNTPTLRGVIATARSIARYGLTVPQRWENPLFAVWNFTNRCNLRCNHCYQSSDHRTAEGELTLPEKLNLVDQFGRAYMAMIAFAGGEPTLHPDLEPVLSHCQKYGMHTSLATHGGLLTPERCKRYAKLGVRYVEVSLDSVDPQRHDEFRGQPGMWRSAVTGIHNVVATEGLRAGIAMCVHRENYHEVDAMIRFAIAEGVGCFAHFNFIPVGRGADMAHLDITPQQREELLKLLHDWMQTRQIGVISTAPQFGRLCLMHAGQDGLVSCSHAGNGPGVKARVVARYLGGCGAGRTYACIQPNGDVTPCVYMPGRIMGNVREKPFTEIFQQNDWWDMFCDRDAREGNCRVCDYRHYCGGCRARADAYFGRLDHVDPGCLLNQTYWDRLIETANQHECTPSLIETADCAD
ncbi:MAG: radical SAM protein [Sedimentisphaerales bacterium]|nr:radical SAM protein [Sedimentisphaerales bacterium]